ncbi:MULTISPECIES: hypothetical protein [unclassified Methylophaga]|jgi:hypothetical protein|nr:MULTISPECIES: hypothetical protein [unclassified Methylophaga]MAL48903.1 hypothetical protein [Methylophaga sp.]MBP25460.1 hypothetical protein [Methylophaga sp.]HCC82657.1 hypothetical protein [Methylophaga sp.]|tara:strand:- start:35439 stop:35948 length:510 start_codon:yes stop_codon:yes gene_type:complete
MKKSMLFFAALLFSINVNAATLSLTGTGSIGATQNVDLNNNSTVLAGGFVAARGLWSSAFNATTDADTPVVIEWSFNPTTSLGSAQLAFGEVGGPLQMFNISSDFIFNASMTAGTTYLVAILNATSNILKYDLSISPSAVPIPAALWLLAPALMGFFGLRRRALKSATA